MNIYYEVVGKGYPIVCLHGNGEDHHIYDDLTKVMCEHYSLILIDSRYHGKSICQGKLSYKQMAEDVKGVIDELQLEAYDAIGFSDGGIIALMLAMEDERLKHIVSIGANTKPHYIKPIYRLFMYMQLICLLPFCIYNKKARLSFRLNRLMLKEPMIEYEQLNNIRIPVLVMAGGYDMITEEDTRNIASSLPYGILKIIARGNHFLLKSSFEETIKEILLFLSVAHKED